MRQERAATTREEEKEKESILLVGISRSFDRYKLWFQGKRYLVKSCSGVTDAKQIVKSTHVDAVIAEQFLGEIAPRGGTELASWLNVHRSEYGGSEYPICVVVGVWNEDIEETVRLEDSDFAEYDFEQILQRLKTALRMAERSVLSTPQFEIIFESPVFTRHLRQGCTIKKFMMRWGRKPRNITPPSIEAQLFLCFLLLRRNQPLSIDSIAQLLSDIPFYRMYLGVPRHWSYNSVKEEHSRLKAFLIGKIKKHLVEKMLKTRKLIDNKQIAYAILGKSLKQTCVVVEEKDRT